MTRIGFATGYGAATGVREDADWMRRAEALGFDMGFFSETANLMRDGVSATAAFGLATQRMRLGVTQIVRLRSPVVMAQTTATLDELSAGRLILCLGACTRHHARLHGLEDRDPPAALTEWVEAIRRLLTGDPVTYEGAFVRLSGVRLGWRPVRTRVPIWIAATSRTGLRLAGRIGDGVVLNAVSSPEYSANAVRILKQAVADAGRDWATFEVAQVVNCSIESSHDAAIDAVRWEVASKFNPAKAFAQVGPRKRVGEPHIHEEDLPLLTSAYEKGGMDALTRGFPASWVEGLTASGTPDEVVRRVEQYRAAGVTLPVLRPAAGHQTERLLALFAPRPGSIRS